MLTCLFISEILVGDALADQPRRWKCSDPVQPTLYLFFPSSWTCKMEVLKHIWQPISLTSRKNDSGDASCSIEATEGCIHHFWTLSRNKSFTSAFLHARLCIPKLSSTIATHHYLPWKVQMKCCSFEWRYSYLYTFLDVWNAFVSTWKSANVVHCSVEIQHAFREQDPRPGPSVW